MRYTLSRSEILRGYKSFSRVITSGKSFGIPPLRCYVTRRASGPIGIQAGFSVTRNIRRAVDRNRAKRLMRESFRLNRNALVRGCETSRISLDVVFLYVGMPGELHGKRPHVEIEEAVRKAISNLMADIGR